MSFASKKALVIFTVKTLHSPTQKHSGCAFLAPKFTVVMSFGTA